MKLPSYEKAVRLAGLLEVLDQDTAQAQPFVLNREQRRVLRAILRHRRVVILKGRQIGCSTVTAFALMLVAMMNPGLPCAIVAHDQESANGILAKVKGWLRQMGVKLVVDNTEGIELGNGATIDARTAISTAEGGESRVGRSKSYGFIHATEQAFWRGARAVWAALTSTALKSCRIVVESTGSPGGELFEGIFTAAKLLAANDDQEHEAANDDVERYHGIFFPVEEHEGYRADPSSISDELWAELQQKYSFTRRDSAAWWWAKLQGDLQGDVHRALREYPILPEHAFVAAEGRHIESWTEVPVVEEDGWEVYQGLKGEPVILGVDTAKGVGQDGSAMALVGQWTGKLHRQWKRDDLDVNAFALEVMRTLERHAEWWIVAAVIEGNGVGAPVYQKALEQRHVPVYEQTSSATRAFEGELWERRGRFKHAVETGEVPIGGQLVTEAKRTVVKTTTAPITGEVRAYFVGPDDITSAASFARKWREENPASQRVPPPDPSKRFVPRKNRNKRRRALKGY